MRSSSLLIVSVATFALAHAATGCSSSPSSGIIPIPEQSIDGGFDDIPDEGFGSKPLSPPPDLGATTSAAKAPPPISGGTLAVLADGKTAVAADPDRDRVFIVDTSAATPAVKEVALQDGDEPGRVVEDSHGKVHVALRRGGAIVTINVATATIDSRRDVCAAPRGIAFDKAADAVHVACAGGELVTLPATSGAPTRTLHLDRDLRDVVVRGEKLVVSKFRSARLLTVDSTGKVALLDSLALEGPAAPRSPAVAWRTIATTKAMVVVHQSGQDDPVGTQSGGYGGSSGSCQGIVSGEVSQVQDGVTPTATSTHSTLPFAVLPVDVAASADEQHLAVASPGNAHNGAMPQLWLSTGEVHVDTCGGDWLGVRIENAGEVTAVAFLGNDVLIQSRSPAQLQIIDSGTHTPRALIPLSNIDREDTGHRVFHANSGANVACASCHPEGGDDGRVWEFDGIGRRRTQTFRGGLLGTEPFHWDGDQKDLRMLMTTVFEKRMSGPTLGDDQLGALSKWIDRVPTIPHSKPLDSAAVERGNQLFHDDETACSGCHTGPALTSNKTIDVGTGGPLQVPSLRGVAFRAPYLHTGCAPTLADRFGPCGGGDAHGKTSHLTAAQISDLVAYLETL